MENVKKLIYHIVISGPIRHEKPTVEYTVRTLTASEFDAPLKPENYYEGGYKELELREYLDKSKEVDQNENTWTTNNQEVYNLFLYHCTPEIENKLEGMKIWGTINPKTGWFRSYLPHP